MQPQNILLSETVSFGFKPIGSPGIFIPGVFLPAGYK
jgi:hypothetical protein